MTAQMKRMDIISNNIANTDTTGFKRDIGVTRSFSEELMKRIDGGATAASPRALSGVSLGVFVDDVATDFSQGAARVTGGTLDMSISGDGFFAVRAADGAERYTRDGSFTLAADGALVTEDGAFVLGDGGLIRLNGTGDITVGSDGSIYQGGAAVGRLRLASFANPESLRKIGGNLYRATDESVPVAFTGSVAPGTLELSNVSAVREMVDMIAVSRLYDANQKILTMIDSTMELAASRIASRVS
jgi:flagellar basal-body rod protein FlgG